MRGPRTSRLFIGFAAGLLALSLFGLVAVPLEAGVCEEAFIYCLFDPQPVYAWEIARLAFCGNGYYFCERYVEPILN
jgi:hypothetical protein